MYMGIWNTSGAQVFAPTKLTNDGAGYENSYYSPNLAARGDKVILVYQRSQSQGTDIYFQVRSSAGAAVKGATNLTGDSASGYQPDIVILSDGRILIAWENYQVQYAVLNESYAIIGSIQTLNKMGNYSEGSISLAADQAGRATIIWADQNGGKLIFYALVNSSAQTLVNSMAMKSSPEGYTLSYRGQGITSHTINPTTTQAVDLYLSGPAAKPIEPSTTAELKVNLGNLGIEDAETISVTLTKPADLSIGTVSPSADCVGDTCTWTFDAVNMGFLGSGTLTIPFNMGSVPPGTSYQVTMHISSAEVDEFPTNNDLSVSIVAVGIHTYLPVLVR
ncbi:MAG: hypothetical protein IH586_11065 [Anaerolineaceae bacterium]|nr:hypothetical protein [Anaerolineaceae bacterium]